MEWIETEELVVVSFIANKNLPPTLAEHVMPIPGCIDPPRDPMPVFIGPFPALIDAIEWGAVEGRMEVLAEDGKWLAEVLYVPTKPSGQMTPADDPTDPRGN